MPSLTFTHFWMNQLIWEQTANGSPGGISTDVVDLDTSTNSTEQALSEAFTITPPPYGGTDGVWDTLRFGAVVQHDNLSGPSPDQDIAGLVFRLTDDAGNVIDAHQVSVHIADEDDPAGITRYNIEFTFTSVSPGTYRLFAGETNQGDGEALELQISSVTSTETVCFAEDTLIATPDGPKRVQTLTQGDLVNTKDNGAQPIRWIGTQVLTSEVLRANERLRPISIKAGALGVNVPSSDLVVSPQHRILVDSKIAGRMFNSTYVLCPAKHLTAVPGVDILHDKETVSYTHFLLPQHEIVFSNGAATESLFPGPMALRALGPKQRQEICSVCPEIADRAYEPQPWCTLLNGRQVRRLVQRHIKNNKEFA